MKRVSLRIEDNLYNFLLEYSKKYNKSINNILCDIIFLYMVSEYANI